MRYIIYVTYRRLAKDYGSTRGYLLYNSVAIDTIGRVLGISSIEVVIAIVGESFLDYKGTINVGKLV